MLYRDILVHLDAEPSTATGDRRRAYAISLAAAFDAHLTGLVFDLDLYVPAMVWAQLPVEVRESRRRDSAEGAQRAAEAFAQSARTAGIGFEPRIVHIQENEVSRELASHGRVSDLIVVGQESSDDEGSLRRELIQAALFGTGRPTLIVPYVGYDAARFDRVIVAWDGGREATRAVHDALPLISRARQVEVLVLGDGTAASQGGDPGADLALHLARHGLDVTARRISIADLDVGSAALSHAADFGADLLVMGGFARPRLRQFILGGMTRSILESMTLPVLMSH